MRKKLQKKIPWFAFKRFVNLIEEHRLHGRNEHANAILRMVIANYRRAMKSDRVNKIR